jgi:hypothetical protein
MGLTGITLTIGDATISVGPDGSGSLVAPDRSVVRSVFWAGSGAMLELLEAGPWPIPLDDVAAFETLLERLDVCAAPDATEFEVSK